MCHYRLHSSPGVFFTWIKFTSTYCSSVKCQFISISVFHTGLVSEWICSPFFFSCGFCSVLPIPLSSPTIIDLLLRRSIQNQHPQNDLFFTLEKIIQSLLYKSQTERLYPFTELWRNMKKLIIESTVTVQCAKPFYLHAYGSALGVVYTLVTNVYSTDSGVKCSSANGFALKSWPATEQRQNLS